MNAEEMRIEIAKACGWDIDWPTEWKDRRITRPDGTSFRPSDPRFGKFCYIPDYLNDLNAMHSAEQILFDNKSLMPWWNYCDALSNIVPGVLGDQSHVHATASQRAEAFLKTLGLWKEEEPPKV